MTDRGDHPSDSNDRSSGEGGLGDWGQPSPVEPWAALRGDAPAPAPEQVDVPPQPEEPAPRRRRRRPSSLRTNAVDSSGAALGERVTSSPNPVSESELSSSIINSPPVIGWMRAAGLAPPEEVPDTAPPGATEGYASGADAAARAAAARADAAASPPPKRAWAGRRLPGVTRAQKPQEAAAQKPQEADAPPSPATEAAPVSEWTQVSEWAPATAAFDTPEPAPVPPFVDVAAPEVEASATEEHEPAQAYTAPAPDWTQGSPSWGFSDAPEPTAAVDEPPSVTAELPSVTAEPPGVTAEPPSVTAEPPSVTAEPLGVTPEPTATVDEPSVTGGTSSTEWDTVFTAGNEATLGASKIDLPFEKIAEMSTGSIKKVAKAVSRRGGEPATNADAGSEPVPAATEQPADGPAGGRTLPAPVGTVAKILRDRPELAVIATFAGGLILATLLKRIARR